MFAVEAVGAGLPTRARGGSPNRHMTLVLATATWRRYAMHTDAPRRGGTQEAGWALLVTTLGATRLAAAPTPSLQMCSPPSPPTTSDAGV